MVEINNQRKAFLDMLAWSEGTDNGRQKTRNHGYDVIAEAESYLLITPITLASIALNPALNQRRRTLPGFFPVEPDTYRTGNSLKDFSRKVRTLWHCSRLKNVALAAYD